jgi:hypothetical protein
MSSVIPIRALALAAAVLAAPLTLAAQDAWNAPVNRDRMISVGDTKSGSLSAADPTLEDGSHYQLWYIQGRAGETAVITLRSSAFDAFLAVGRHGGDQMESDDDGAGGTDSRIRITWPSNGTYVIRANSFGEAETGAYTLSVGSPAAGEGLSIADALGLPVNAQRRLVVGRSVTSSLDPEDMSLEDGSHFEAWYIELTAGQRVVITQRSADFDSFLQLGRHGSSEMLETNDDYNENDLNSQIIFTASEAGTYVVIANSLGRGETGNYSLEVTANEAGGSSPADVLGGAGDDRAIRDIAYGQNVSGTLQDGDRVLEDDGTYYDAYVFEGRSGDRVVITMRSSDFDAYLSLRSSGGEVLESNDDIEGGSTTDAQINYTLSRNGRYTIYANSLNEGETGRYTLSLARGS